jgi:hypothetical protein
MQSPQLSPYFLTRPGPALDPDTIADFERLYAEAVEHGTGGEIDYNISAPKWQFLCYLADTKEIVLHGSGASDIEEFEPRQSNDSEEFGNRCAVYAASDGIWSMYFAIVDRDRYVTSLVNACFCVANEDGTEGESYYFFSINDDALPHAPWRNGTLYILPRTTFEQQPHRHENGMELIIAQWASLVPVRPLARLTVTPDDFPFLSQIRGHDPVRIGKLARENPGGFPWLDDTTTPEIP